MPSWARLNATNSTFERQLKQMGNEKELGVLKNQLSDLLSGSTAQERAAPEYTKLSDRLAEVRKAIGMVRTDERQASTLSAMRRFEQATKVPQKRPTPPTPLQRMRRPGAMTISRKKKRKKTASTAKPSKVVRETGEGFDTRFFV